MTFNKIYKEATKKLQQKQILIHDQDGWIKFMEKNNVAINQESLTSFNGVPVIVNKNVPKDEYWLVQGETTIKLKYDMKISLFYRIKTSILYVYGHVEYWVIRIKNLIINKIKKTYGKDSKNLQSNSPTKKRDEGIEGNAR